MDYIRRLDAMVRQNQDIIEYLRHAHCIGDYGMLVGSLDYAISRINTVILRLSQYPLLADQYFSELKSCHNSVRAFHKNMQRTESWPRFLRWYPKFRLHRIGIKRFPRIALLLVRVENSVRDH
jgi:hypothetical protein